MTMIDRRVKAQRTLRRQNSKVVEDGWLSAACKNGTTKGCTHCSSLKCSCRCHLKVLPAAQR